MTLRKDGTGEHRRGTSNTNQRGGALSRRIRKQWVLAWYGDGETCQCYSCGGWLVFATLQVDRIIPGCLGGTYARGNIRPACAGCNRRSGNKVRDMLRHGISIEEVLTLCRGGLL